MLLWAGIILIALGTATLAVDRAIAHFLYDHVSQAAHKRLDSITHAAKAGHWLAAAIDSGAILIVGYAVSAASGGSFWMALAAAGLSYHAAGTAVLGQSPASWSLASRGLPKAGLSIVLVGRKALEPVDIPPGRLDHQVTAVD